MTTKLYDDVPVLVHAISFAIVLNLVCCPLTWGSDGLQWNRCRLNAGISLIEEYSDNIYLQETDEINDTLMTLTPSVLFDFAIASKNYISLNYIGDYLFFNKFDNIKTDHHLSEIAWDLTTGKGSRFNIGASVFDSAIQPYSEADTTKDFLLYRGYTNFLFKVGKLNEIGVEYEHKRRRFNRNEFRIDDFNKDAININYLYKYSIIFPLLLDYRYVQQENYDIADETTDLITHTVFIGSSWRSLTKLTGNLRLGHTTADYDNNDAFNDFVYDIDLTYQFSSLTGITIRAERGVRKTTRTARDTGDYFIFNTVGVETDYKKFSPLELSIELQYQLKEYMTESTLGFQRNDNHFATSLKGTYSIRDWFSVLLGYRYQTNNSDLDGLSYSENRITLELDFSL